MTKTTPARRPTTSDRVKRGMPADHIVNGTFGGLAAFCKATGFNASTVHNWLRSGLVPAKWIEPGLSYQRFIIGCAKSEGLTVTPADFIENADQ